MQNPAGVDASALWPLADTGGAYASLIRRLSPLHAAITADPAPEPEEAMAARLVANHLWRRVVLRDPRLPAALLHPTGRDRMRSS